MGASGGPSFEQVDAVYQSALHRPATQQEYEDYWANDPNFEAGIRNSDEAQAYAAKQQPAVPRQPGTKPPPVQGPRPGIAPRPAPPASPTPGVGQHPTPPTSGPAPTAPVPGSGTLGPPPPPDGTPGTFQPGSPNDPASKGNGPAANAYLETILNNGSAGTDMQALVDRLNAQFALPSGRGFQWYPDKKVIAASGGGYYAQKDLNDPKSAWGYNVGDSQGGGNTGGGNTSGPGTTAGAPGNSALASYFTNAPLLQPWTTQFQYPNWAPPPEWTPPTGVTEQNDPGYKFRLQEAQNAIQKSAAAAGTLLTGGTLKDLDQYSQGLASQEYANVYGRSMSDYNTKYNASLNDWTQNYNLAQQQYSQAYNIFENNQANQYNRISNLAGLGQVAATNLGQGGLGYSSLANQSALGTGNTLAGLYTGIGNAQAAGGVGGANALTGSLGSIYGLSQFLHPPNQSSYGTPQQQYNNSPNPNGN